MSKQEKIKEIRNLATNATTTTAKPSPQDAEFLAGLGYNWQNPHQEYQMLLVSNKDDKAKATAILDKLNLQTKVCIINTN